MADPWQQQMELWQGTWFNTLDPFYGYLHIKPFKNEDEGGDAVAIVHARHGKTDPPIWYQGVWKPTDMGFEVWAGPYHWTQCATFCTPKTRDTPNPRLYFYSYLNGWGQCNFGKLGDEDEQKFIDQLKDVMPTWQQEEKTYPKDYPSATWPESKKHLRAQHTFDGDGAPPSLIPGIPPEDNVTHNGGQHVTPQVALRNPMPPVGGDPNQPGPPPPQPPPPGGTSPDGGGGGGQQPPPNGGGNGGQTPPGNGGNGGGGQQQPPQQGQQQKPPEQSGGQQGGQPGGEQKPAEGDAKTSQSAPETQSAPASENEDEGKGWISRAVDRTTDAVDSVTRGASEKVTEKVDNAVDNASKATGKAVSGAADAVLGANESSDSSKPKGK